jgi:hypothetical protein
MPSDRSEPPPSGYPVGLFGHVEIACAERLTQHLTLLLSMRDRRAAPDLLVSDGAHPGPSPTVALFMWESTPRHRHQDPAVLVPVTQLGNWVASRVTCCRGRKTQHHYNEITSFVDRGLRNLFFGLSPPLVFSPCRLLCHREHWQKNVVARGRKGPLLPCRPSWCSCSRCCGSSRAPTPKNKSRRWPCGHCFMGGPCPPIRKAGAR